ncbi:arylsulfatase [Marinilabiliaceae bacterium ANBcel2]|nr:arylsulfatase [Marinilabiliaceae bacterium ANBcel2]
MKSSLFKYSSVAPALGLLSLAACDTSEKSIPEDPNIIYIFVDDLGYGDLSSYGQTKFATPNIDRIAQEGIKFTNHYSGSTVSAPSRSALMTGLHTGNTPIRGNKEIEPEGQHPMPADTRTVAHELQDAGYATGAVGKWGLGYPGSVSDPLKMGFDYFFGANCQRHAHHYYLDYLWENDQRVEYDKPVYTHDKMTKKAFEFVESNKDKPFFLYLPYKIPHAEMVLPDEYLEPFIGKYPEPNPWGGGHYGAQEHPRAALAAMITHLDNDIGRLLDLLEELGIDDNTVVLFTSDNGPHVEGGNDPDFFDSNGGLRGYKRDLYEGGIRVPFVVRWPGVIEPGRVSDHISANWDMYPTFCEIAQLDVPEGLDGISMLPEFLGKEQKSHEYLYWEFHEMGGRQAVRMGDWKGVRYGIFEGNLDVELYNLVEDPAEKNDLSADYPEIASQIADIMENGRTPSELFPFPLD